MHVFQFKHLQGMVSPPSHRLLVLLKKLRELI
jgi:hypothetical protein